MPLKLVRRPRSPYWHIRGTLRGVRVVESTGLVDKAKAEEALIRRSDELIDRSIHGAPATMTFAEAALSYMEDGDGERKHLKPILELIGAKKLRTIDQSVIDGVARKLKPKASNATRNRHVHTPISAVLHHAAR